MENIPNVDNEKANLIEEKNDSKISCYILLGRTGVGKSTLAKILSENNNIVIGNTMDPQTQKTDSYECEIDGFKYVIFDTPGYDDNNKNDDKNFAAIKEILSSEEYSVKGIFYLFSFQDPKFSDSHRKGLQKIINLVPLDNFWDYFTFIFTKTFSPDDDLDDLKEEKLKNIKNIFEPLISAYEKAKNIKIVDFSKIKKVFVNLRGEDKKNKKKTDKKDNQLKELINIFKDNSKLPPLFHKMVIEKDVEKEIFILDENDKEKGKLYKCKCNIYKYYDNKNKPIKEIGNLDKKVEPKFIKEMTKNEYGKRFGKIFNTTFTGSILGMYACAIGGLFFPPLVFAAFGFAGLCWAHIPIGFGFDIVNDINNGKFNEQMKKMEEEIYKDIIDDFPSNI